MLPYRLFGLEPLTVLVVQNGGSVRGSVIAFPEMLRGGRIAGMRKLHSGVGWLSGCQQWPFLGKGAPSGNGASLNTA